MGIANVGRQYVDPLVSHTKFDREISEYRTLEEEHYRTRGWFLVKAGWPEAIVVLTSYKTAPAIILAAVRFDYTNYDAEPPSVRIVNPFTGQPLKSSEILLPILRKVVSPDGSPQPPQPLLQAASPDSVPFLCIPGVKEYHDHPAHTGDAWELHRQPNEGRLVHLLEAFSRYGSDQVVGLNINTTYQINLAMAEAPE